MQGHAQVNFIGQVKSELKTVKDCPCQEKEGAPAARVEIFPPFRDALNGIKQGSHLVILTWFHKANRETLKVHPRGNPKNPLAGVFFTRSPNRPNPIGLHTVRVTDVDENGLTVEPLEALDKTPVIDIKISIPMVR